MADLTDAQIAYIRAKSGDQPCNGDEVVSDALMQTYFDMNDGSLACTIVSVLEDRLANVKGGAAIVTDFGTRVDNSERDSITKLRDYWREQCGNAGAPIQVGTLNLGIDARCEDGWL